MKVRIRFYESNYHIQRGTQDHDIEVDGKLLDDTVLTNMLTYLDFTGDLPSKYMWIKFFLVLEENLTPIAVKRDPHDPVRIQPKSFRRALNKHRRLYGVTEGTTMETLAYLDRYEGNIP